MSVLHSDVHVASGLIAGGMNWCRRLVTILLGNVIVLIPMLLNAPRARSTVSRFPCFVRGIVGRPRRECAAGWRALGRLAGGSGIWIGRAGDPLHARHHLAATAQSLGVVDLLYLRVCWR